MADTVFHDDGLDPELAAILNTGGNKTAGPLPDFSSIFGTEGGAEEEILDNEDGEGPHADSGDPLGGSFPEISKKFETNPHNFFADPNYYKIALSGEGDSAARAHGILQKYLNCKDPKDRSVFRQQFITVYWDFLSGVAKKAGGKIPPAKRFLLRFGILHPVFLDQETRAFFSKLVVEDELGQPIYYMDEWLKNVGLGSIQPSTTDEVQVSRSNPNARFQQFLEKARGKLEGSLGLLRAKDDERQNQEQNLRDRMEILLQHSAAGGSNISTVYSESQKRAIAEIQELLKGLLRTDRELEIFLRDYRQAEEDVRTIQSKISEGGDAATVDTGALAAEFDTIRQMVKMTVGRKGNHFPVLTSEYFHNGPNDTGFRENVISILAGIESIDPECFYRVYKNKNNRIVPYVILIPSYGDLGFCWEPFSRNNRATSRGRIIVPMYPRNLQFAILSAIGDLRWQVAKEKASFYWMEEGLTGNYYQWFQKMKLKGNIKDYFVQDYIQWMTKESEGTQKLDKEIRGIFWRFMPFSQAVKEKLKNRSFVYQELFQRDLNRTMSDGY
jgi:hypothetical protein